MCGMATVYTTRSGDVWDSIAKEFYGSESYVSFLMSNNQQYLGYFIFPAGIELTVTELPQEDELLPDWRK